MTTENQNISGPKPKTDQGEAFDHKGAIFFVRFNFLTIQIYDFKNCLDKTFASFEPVFWASN